MRENNSCSEGLFAFNLHINAPDWATVGKKEYLRRI